MDGLDHDGNGRSGTTKDHPTEHGTARGDTSDHGTKMSRLQSVSLLHTRPSGETID